MGLSVKPKEFIDFLTHKGFKYLYAKGSHAKYTNGKVTVVVPVHNKDLGTGLLLELLSQAQATKKDLLNWLGR